MSITYNFLVILSFCLFIVFLALEAETSDSSLQKQAWIDECLNQLNVIAEEGAEYPTIDPAQRDCFIACMVKKLGKNRETLRQILQRAIEEIKLVNSVLFRNSMDKLDKCWEKVQGDECKLIYCINLFKNPFGSLLQQQSVRDLH